MALKFNTVITFFKTCKRKISILNSKYYESPFEKFRIRKNYIMITNSSKNNSNIRRKMNFITWEAYLGN